VRSQINLWLSHPVTKILFRNLAERRKETLEHFLNIGYVSEESIWEIAHLKARMNTLDLLLDPESLENLLDEVEKDEVETAKK
jgi:PIN domain nuclease of toxin-antitoxin system